MRALSSLLLLLSLPAAAATVPLPEAPPPGFALDGDVAEWTEAPNLTLGAAEQLTGEAASPEDFSAKIWWAADLSGLVFAADVSDDAVRFAPRGTDPNLGDHISLWIALPGAELPPIAVVTDRGELIVRSPNDCNNQSAISDPDRCRAWYAEQLPRRAQMAHLNVRNYELTLDQVMETWAGVCLASPGAAPSLTNATCRASQVKLKRTDHGYSVEARIALSDFPATNANPLTHLRLLVDAVDNDVGNDAQEATFASSKTADPNRPDTLPRYDLLRPPLFDSVPPAFAAAQLLDGATGLFYYPDLKLKTAYVLENVLGADPAGHPPPSPVITPLDWSAPKRLGVIDDLEIYDVPGDGAPCEGCAVGRRLLFVRDDAAVAAEDLGPGSVKVLVNRGEVLHAVVSQRAPVDPGQPSGPVEHTLRVLEITDGADVTEVLKESLISGAAQEGYLYSALSEQVVPDGSALGFIGKRQHEGSAEKPVDFMRLYTWNPDTGAYELDPTAK